MDFTLISDISNLFWESIVWKRSKTSSAGSSVTVTRSPKYSLETINFWWRRNWENKITSVELIPKKYIPAPNAIPTPTVAQIPAAVVTPIISCLPARISPAPRKPTPLATLAATREASTESPWVMTSKNPYFEITTINALVSATRRCVFNPAFFSRFFRSRPMNAPQIPATIIRNKSSIWINSCDCISSVISCIMFSLSFIS